MGLDSGERRQRVATALGIEYPRNMANFSSQVSNPQSPSSRPRLGRMSSYHVIPRNSNRTGDRIYTALVAKNKSSRNIQETLGQHFRPKVSVSPFDDEYEAYLGPTYDITAHLTPSDFQYSRQSSRRTPHEAKPPKQLPPHKEAPQRNSNLYSKLQEKNGELLLQLGSATKVRDGAPGEELDRKPTVSLYAPSTRRVVPEIGTRGIRTDAFLNIDSMRLRPERNLETQESISSRPDSVTERYKRSKEGFESLQGTGELKLPLPKRPKTGSLIEDLRSIPAVVSPRNHQAGTSAGYPPKFKPTGLFSKKSVKDGEMDRKLTFAAQKEESNVWSVPSSVAKFALEEPLSDDGDPEAEPQRSFRPTPIGSTRLSRIFEKHAPKDPSPAQPATQRGEILRKKAN